VEVMGRSLGCCVGGGLGVGVCVVFGEFCSELRGLATGAVHLWVFGLCAVGGVWLAGMGVGGVGGLVWVGVVGVFLFLFRCVVLFCVVLCGVVSFEWAVSRHRQ